MVEFDLICCIVNSGQGSKVLKIAKNNGVSGGTIFKGLGTVRNRLLEILDLDEARREIVFMASESGKARKAAGTIDRDMAFRKPHHGIAFTLPIDGLYGSHSCGDDGSGKEYTGNKVSKDSEDIMAADNNTYSAIITIVDRGCGEDVVDASKEAGARGATIIHSRGAGIHETGTLFAMPIEPEKDMVLVLAKNDICEGIISSIREKLSIDKPGAGIIFSMPVSETYGLY